jgi:hypothetical protein
MSMLQESAERLAEETKERKRLHNLVQELKGNIRVCFGMPCLSQQFVLCMYVR